MGNYSRGGYGGRDRGGFGGGFRGGGGFERRERRPVEMHDVICDKCKKECQVPFKPTEGKPVLCSDCFKQSGGGSSRGGSSGISPEQFNQLNTKLDKILKLLECDCEECDADVKEDAEEIVEEVKAE